MNKDIMKQLGFSDFVNAVESNKCPTCSKPIDATTFRNDISFKEFELSGMCQKCQDNIFGED